MTEPKTSTRILSFGDLFSYKDNNYVYLMTDEKSDTHVGKILSVEETKNLEEGCINAERRLKELAICYVVLKTPEFIDQGAVFPCPYTFSQFTTKLQQCLDLTDLKEIQKEILSSRAIPDKIKEEIKKIKLQ